MRTDPSKNITRHKKLYLFLEVIPYHPSHPHLVGCSVKGTIGEKLSIR